MVKKKIILASSSPRRIELLKNEGFDVFVIPANIEEAIDNSLPPHKVVESLAYEKALSVRNSLRLLLNSASPGDSPISSENFDPSIAPWVAKEDVPIVAADTIVFHNSIMGKPLDKEDAQNILMDLSGKEHQVYTGVAILSSLEEKELVYSEKTSVFFKKYALQDIEDYLNTEEPYDKAGAYAIQGYFSRFIDHIEGDYYNVMGLPIKSLCSAISRF